MANPDLMLFDTQAILSGRGGISEKDEGLDSLALGQINGNASVEGTDDHYNTDLFPRT